jgi:hypothetical protein
MTDGGFAPKSEAAALRNEDVVFDSGTDYNTFLYTMEYTKYKSAGTTAREIACFVRVLTEAQA